MEQRATEEGECREWCPLKDGGEGRGVPLPFIFPLVPSKSLGTTKGSLVSWPQQCLLLAPEIEAS